MPAVPLVSVIIPCHNAGRWLAATLDSVLAQTHPRTEVIVVDDGSTDDSLAVARRYEARGVRVATQPNRGASAARNHGMRLASGDYLQFLDADDLLSPEKIGRQVMALASRPGSVASCRWARFTDDPGAAVFADDEVARDFLPLDFLLLHTASGRMMHPAAWLVPRPVADRAGPWDERLTLNDDGEYFARVVLAAEGIVCVPEVHSFYRSGLPGSLSRRRSRAALESLYLSIEKVSQAVGRAESSVRVQQALADYWQRLVYELYPEAPDLSRQAAREAAARGGSRVAPSMGNRERQLARVVGWRLARRLKSILT
ncbi:MAG: glycosyltransferase family 2 protein [Verrucomicrobia bacterium]|nr:glycosyltransferase family 2 protein [Verrucomicrobiota bacterium]